MPARCFMQTDAMLSPEVIERDLKTIIYNRFNNLFKLEAHSKNGEICDWEIIFDNIYNFPICLKTQHNLEFTHPDNYFSLWAQLIFEDELAIKYNAKMFDEEYPKENIHPDCEHHATFKVFLETIMANHSKQWKDAIIAIELSYLPEELKKL